jgi:hypothetical protein
MAKGCRFSAAAAAGEKEAGADVLRAATPKKNSPINKRPMYPNDCSVDVMTVFEFCNDDDGAVVTVTKLLRTNTEGTIPPRAKPRTGMIGDGSGPPLYSFILSMGEEEPFLVGGTCGGDAMIKEGRVCPREASVCLFTTPTKTIAVSSSHHTTYYYRIYCTSGMWSTVNPIVMSRVVAARNGNCLGRGSICVRRKVILVIPMRSQGALQTWTNMARGLGSLSLFSVLAMAMMCGIP